MMSYHLEYISLRGAALTGTQGINRGTPLSAAPKLCPNRICWSRLGCLLSEKQIPQTAVNIWNGRKTMEPLEPTRAPCAQGVVSSNLAAPTNRINNLQ